MRQSAAAAVANATARGKRYPYYADDYKGNVFKYVLARLLLTAI
jgi:hypothetical protein